MDQLETTMKDWTDEEAVMAIASTCLALIAGFENEKERNSIMTMLEQGTKNL